MAGRYVLAVLAWGSLAFPAGCSDGTVDSFAIKQDATANSSSRTPTVTARSAVMNNAPPITVLPTGTGAEFVLRYRDASVFLGDSGFAVALTPARHAQTSVGWGLQWTLPGADQVSPRPDGQLPGRVNYLVGDASRWKTDLATYSRVIYDDVYPGVDLEIESRQAGIEYRFVVAADAATDAIRMQYEGALALDVVEHGAALEIGTGLGVLREDGLRCYQDRPTGRRDVACGYAVVERADNLAWTYEFEIAPFDPKFPLVIDPTLSWSSYLGGAGSEFGWDITVDSSDNVYVTGYTNSADFPTTGGFDTTFAGTQDAFVAKVNAATSTLIWSSYLGGAADDYGYGVAVDSAGNVYVTGKTFSADFPAMGGFDTTLSGTVNSFVTKVNPGGSTLAWSSYLGGSNADYGADIAVDDAGDVYVVGGSGSSDYPSIGGFDTTLAGTLDAVVTKVNADGSSLAWSSYLGGIGYEQGEAIAVDGGGNVYVSGSTESSDFPTSGGFDTTYGGLRDAFVTKVNADGSTLAWSSYLGGTGVEGGRDIATDGLGNVFVTGTTEFGGFPTTGGFDTTYGGSRDAFVAKVNAIGSSLAWSSYLGGFNVDTGDGVAVDGDGFVYIAGSTSSGDFPTSGGFDTTYGGSTDAFVTRVNADGSSLAWSSYLGGAENDRALGIAVDTSGNAYVTGYTSSADFPTIAGFDTTFGGSADTFVTRLAQSPTGASCINDGECLSNNCVDGVCCETACGEGDPTDCQACSVAAGAPTDGTCDTVVAGTSCGLCQTCDSGGSCSLTPTDDSACGVIDCDGRDTSCRDFSDITANRCEGAGDCKDPNTTDCVAFVDVAAGTNCGLCAACDGAGTCGMTPADDAACGEIDCDGLDTICRDYDDLIANRCEAFGDCADPNTADCIAYSDTSTGTYCGLCSSCDGAGSCSLALSDDDACGVIDCDGGDTPCRDYADLTDDRCDGAGACKEPNGAGCSTFDNAPAGSSCAPCGACDGTGDCKAIADGTSCENALFCSLEDTCIGGECTAGAARNCYDSNPCTADTCSEADGECQHESLSDGGTCSTGTVCGGQCLDGQCQGGTPVDCEDDTACTVDTCNPTTLECINSPVPDGTGCDDGDPTTTDDVCLAGLCAGTSDEPDAGVGGERERGGCGCSTRGKPTQVGWLPLLALAWFLRRSRCPRTSRNRRALGGNPRT